MNLPVMQPMTPMVIALTADLAVCRMWQPQTMELIDLSINDTGTPIYVVNSVESIIALHETEKRTGQKLYKIDSLLSCIKLMDCLFGNSYSKI